jgi:hypothetical protein
MRFSSVLGWWIATLLVVSTLRASKPEYDTFQA